uniref:RGS domain-containing protein n=1 Tax=Pygocentrus nattereri TaxID=42514 RepID=A0A3B4DT36_PYGNA
MCRGLAALPNTCLESVGKNLIIVMGLQCTDVSVLCCLICVGCTKLMQHVTQVISFYPPPSDGLYAFRAFLVSEFSEENIAFYLACEDYRNTTSAAKLCSKAQRIYNEFIGSEAPREVNIDHETRDITQANVKSPTPTCFDLAQYRIYILMEKDCYPRFLRSSAYRDLVSHLTKKNTKAATKKA